MDLRRERVINLSEGREDQTSTHMAKAVTQANLLGWSTYSFFSTLGPAASPFPLCGLQHRNGSHREEQHLRGGSAIAARVDEEPPGS